MAVTLPERKQSRMANQNREHAAQVDIDQQLKQLELDRRTEELKQLRANSRRQWITPAALAMMVPLLVGFGLWIVGEIKQYGEGYEALKEVVTLRREKDELQKTKNSLNIELATLLGLKTHYYAEAEHLRRETETQQANIDKSYLGGVFAHDEVVYALSLVEGLPAPPDEEELKLIRNELKALPQATADKINTLLNHHQFALAVIDASKDVVAEFDEALKLMPASGWTHELHSRPSGSVLSGRKIMLSENGPGQKYYDVTKGDYLSPEELKAAKQKVHEALSVEPFAGTAKHFAVG